MINYINKTSNRNRYNPTFKSGLTKDMLYQIPDNNVYINKYFKKNNINVDFKNNNAIAYCCFQSLEYIKLLNKKLGSNFGLPNQIIVEDFNKLKGNLNDSWGICNLLPTKLYKNSDKIVPERTVMFNSNLMCYKDKSLLEYMNDVAEFQKQENIESSSHFLIKFMHEFAHSIHEENLQRKYSSLKVVKIIKDFLNPDNIRNFQSQFSNGISQKICKYAAVNPFETVACDLSKKILNPSEEKFDVYMKENIFQKIFKEKDKHNENKIDTLIKNTWNGKMF